MKSSTRTFIVLVSALAAFVVALLFYASTRTLHAPVAEHKEAVEADTKATPGPVPRPQPDRSPAEGPIGTAPEKTASSPVEKPREAHAEPHKQLKLQKESAPALPRVRKDGLAVVDQLLERLDVGNIVFNAPREMAVDEPTDIQLVLGIEKALEELRRQVTAQGEKTEAQIRVSDRMEARLSGSNFSITALTPEIQAISRSESTQWRWEVIPKKTGKHVLHLTLDVLLDIDGGVSARNLRTFDEEIEVQVSWPKVAAEFLRDNWQWLWAAVLVPLGPWAWNKLKRKKRRA
jgi:hypothetical protein